MAIGDVLRVSIRANLHSQETINTFYYKQNTGVGVEGEAQAANLVNAILTSNWWAPYKALHSNEWLAVFANVIKLSTFSPPLTLSPTYTVDILDQAGTQNSESLPTSIAVSVKRKTDQPGRRGRGRIFLTGFPQPWEKDSKIDTANTSFDVAMTAFLANINATLTQDTLSWQPVHYMPSATGNLWTEIRTWEYDFILRNQRRRQWGRGI